MTKSHLALVTPTAVFGSVRRGHPPRRRPNAESRAREYLTLAEVEKLMKAAGDNRYGHRDATMVQVAYRHGLRPVELVTLPWDAVDFAHGQIHLSRAKHGSPSVHPLSGRELRALRRLRENRTRHRLMCSRRNVEHRLAPPGSGPRSPGLARRPASISGFIPICCATPVATH